MPSYVPDALAIVNLIKRNLQDRYASGYPILKELLQNADDARARRFSLDALPGWRDAGNPLLQGPGLLVANDGEFSLRDRKGILAFGDSVKATDRAAVGRFGLGQKAVFHLCDAFVVHAFDEDWEEGPFRSVVNPFLDVKVTDNVTSTWEDLQDDDVDRLRGRRKVGRRALFLWLPFRRPDLRPARDIVGFSRDEPRIDDTVRELARTDELQVLLSALRNLESIEILETAGRSVPYMRAAPTGCSARMRGRRANALSAAELGCRRTVQTLALHRSSAARRRFRAVVWLHFRNRTTGRRQSPSRKPNGRRANRTARRFCCAAVALVHVGRVCRAN